jgi:membrane-bound lytic murein transglycosylase A
VGFSDLPGWSEEGLLEAFNTFRKSCKLMSGAGVSSNLKIFSGLNSDGSWKSICRAAYREVLKNDAEAQSFFTRYFVPWKIGGSQDRGLFTGYYEIEILGSRIKNDSFRYPIYARPNDLVRVPLRKFDPGLPKRAIVGRITDGVLSPYPTRREIVEGGLPPDTEIIAWARDPADVFFLHIQGSGRIVFVDGGQIQVGYSASNGRPYRSIGQVLIKGGHLSRKNVSMQSIRKWLLENPQKVADVFNKNTRYIFFKKLDRGGPQGSMGVILTPGFSIAVDPSFIPLGAPVWIDTERPISKKPLRRLVVAQDTGAAIRGGVRADIFFGHGKHAESSAGKMNEKGRLYVLFPRGKGQLFSGL